jgi:hypothetical protein
VKGNGMIKGKKKKTTRSAVGLSALDDFLKDQGKLEVFQAKAIREVQALANHQSDEGEQYFPQGPRRAQEDER